MDKTITIKGKTYKLVPLESLVEEYERVADSKTIPSAQPKVSDYRERYKKHEIRPDEVIARPSYPAKLLKKVKKPEDLSEGDFFGPGLEIDY